MKTVKPFRLSMLSRPYRWQGETRLGVAVTALVSLDGRHQLLPEQALWHMVADEFGGTPLDLGVPKAQAEFLVAGLAHTCHQDDDTACAVRAQVAGLEKSLLVFGERYWLDGRASPPASFETLRVDWQHAWGGANETVNPLGTGAAAEQVEGLTVHRLPNVESPDARLHTPGQRMTPAGFGGIDPSWPQRMALMGSAYGQAWLENEYPGFACDMDWRYFNAAPADQHLPGPELPPGAPYAFWNLHPTQPVMRGTLPDWRARCFVSRRTDGSELAEIPLSLSTAWFVPHREAVILIWHGAEPIIEDDAAEIAHIMPAIEPADAPRPPDHYAQVLRQRLDPALGAAHAMRDEDLLPAAHLGNWDIAMPDPQRDPLARNLRRGAERERARQREALLTQGLDPDEHLPDLPAAESAPKVDELADVFARNDEQAQHALTELRAQMNEMASQAGVQLHAKGQDGSLPPAPSADAPIFDAVGTLADLALMAAAGDEAAAREPAVQAAAHARMLELYRHSAATAGRATRLDKKASEALADAVRHRLDRGISLARVDLTGADLSGLDFRGASLAGALLESANLAGARLDNCDLTGAILVGCDLDGASLANACLANASLLQASGKGICLDAADLTQTDFRQSRLSHCSFAGARCDATQFEQAELADCSFREARFTNVAFMRQTLTRPGFADVAMERTTWVECRLSAPDFSGAQLRSCAFFQTRVEQGNFSAARLETCSVAHQSSLQAAVLSGATLRECGLRGADLSASRMDGAHLENCDMSGATLRQAVLDGIEATDCLFVRTDFTEASLLRADLIQAILQKADFSAARLGGANLFRADLGQARLDTAAGLDTAYTDQVKIWPRYKDAAA